MTTEATPISRTILEINVSLGHFFQTWNFEWCHQGNDLSVHRHTSFEKLDKSLTLLANIYTNYPVALDRIYVSLQYLADQYNAIRL